MSFPRRLARAGHGLIASALAWLSLLNLVAQAKPLNLVLILADDLGAHDLAVTGSRFHETPNLDRLAREGMRFTQAYSACTVCSPSRAALMTAKYPARLQITDWIAGHDDPRAKLKPPVDWVKQLPLAETTLAERARSEGYATAHMGKWHLGPEGFWPNEQGFDLNVGGYSQGQPPRYFSPYNIPTLKDGPKGEYLTDREADEAVRFITANRDRSFFLNYWPYSVHTPLQAPPALVEKYRRKAAHVGGSQTNAVYAAMLERLDAAVGRVLEALNAAGIADRTVVIFSSDNGGLVLGPVPPTSNAPLRSGKGSPYEGGVRVPLLVKWPGVTQPGSTSGEPVITMDLAATAAAVFASTPQGTPPAGLADGLNLRPVLENPAVKLSREAIFWHYPHYHPGGSTPYAALRDGDWKLIQYYEDGRHELFHLTVDPGEQNNVAADEPARVMELARKLLEWQGKVGAQWPMYNPAHQPPPLTASADGSVLLHARRAEVHGTVLRYEPMPFKNTLGWWGRAEDWPSWSFILERGGTYEIELLQGCGGGHGGSEVNVEIGNTKLPFRVEETGHFQNFVPRRLGRVTLSDGTHSIALKVQRKQGGAVMDVRQIRLVPVAEDSRLATTALGLLAAKRVVWLGDSITYGGEWAEWVETWVRLRFQKSEIEFINLGLPSETASGLSEEGHAGGAFPRPDVHERLGRLLEKVKPDLIVACYGMNDGIYFPFSEDRFRKYQEGIRRLRERAAHEGVRLIHLTPPVFDPQPLAGRTLPAGRDTYPQPFQDYNGVLDRYSDWLVHQKTNGWEVVDVHGPMNRFLAERRRVDPEFLLAGDGVHVNSQGHWLMARELLRHWGADPEVVDADQPEMLLQTNPRGAEVLRLVQQRARLLKDAWLTHVGHRRPGMDKGKPLADAESEARVWAAQLRDLK